VLARSDLELSAVDSILASLGTEAVPPADPTVLQLLGEADRPDLAALYARTHAPAEPRSPS
jgi:hypothetical protein